MVGFPTDDRGYRLPMTDTTTSPASSDSDVDDQFRALLEGVRASLPGVEVLFAFLLVVPLQSSFGELSGGERAMFSVAFYSAAVASVLLIAPSVHQRVRAPRTGVRRHSHRHLIITAWVTIVGTLAMGVAIVATVLFASSLAHGTTEAVVASGLVAAVVVAAWLYLPLVTFERTQ